MEPAAELAALRARIRELDGAELTRVESRAWGKLEKEIAAAAVKEFAAAVPKSIYCKMAGRQNKLVDEFGGRYDIPQDGPTIDLWAVLPVFHDRISELAAAARPALDGDEADLLREKLKQEIGKLQRQSMQIQISIEQSQSKLIARESITTGMDWLAGRLRSLGAAVHRHGGQAAVDAVNQFLDELAAEIESGTLRF